MRLKLTAWKIINSELNTKGENLNKNKFTAFQFIFFPQGSKNAFCKKSKKRNFNSSRYVTKRFEGELKNQNTYVTYHFKLKLYFRDTYNTQ